TDPLVIKSTIMNSADKVLDKQGNAWAPSSAATIAGVYTTTRPLDTDSGAGQINGATLATQYLAGDWGPGAVPTIGWDINKVGNGQFVDYAIDSKLLQGTFLTATLDWNRHVGWSDNNANSFIDASDTFFLLQSLSNLDLEILKNGVLVAQSTSFMDNVEH